MFATSSSSKVGRLPGRSRKTVFLRCALSAGKNGRPFFIVGREKGSDSRQVFSALRCIDFWRYVHVMKAWVATGGIDFLVQGRARHVLSMPGWPISKVSKRPAALSVLGPATLVGLRKLVFHQRLRGVMDG